MKDRQHILPCGRVMFFREYTPRDFALYKTVEEAFFSEKKAWNKFSSYAHAGRRKKIWVQNTYNKFVTLLVAKLVSHLMESDRVKTAEGRYWIIRTVSLDSDKHLNWHTDGAVMGVKISGISGDYRILLSRKRGKELKERIEKGQKFHVYEQH